MKTFKDLEFETHPNFKDGKQGKIFFENGYGASVINGYGSYTHNGEWELAVLFGNKDKYELTYDTHITSNVIGHLTENEVTDILKQIQEL